MNKEKDKTLTSTSYKHPVFDGQDPNEFKDWWDNVFATLEMEDIEEYVTEVYKGKETPSKEETIPEDLDDANEGEERKKMKLVRKEMKNAKAHMVRVTKDFPKRLVMEAEMPNEAYAALKAKYSVSKNKQDFTKLDKEWNEFMVKDPTSNPDKIFATLEEHSKNLAIFWRKV